MMAADLKPLAGVNVLEFSWSVAGPVVGRCLADYGATVIRVESAARPDVTRLMGPFPGGKVDLGKSGLYENCNAGKLGLSLDMAKPEGRAVAAELVQWADIVSESFSPGQMDKWGLGYERLARSKPSLIMLSMSLMGQGGRLAKMAGFGNLGAALAGIQSMVGLPNRPPIGPFGAYTDYLAPRFALFATLAALDARDRTGKGAWIDLGQAESALHFLAPQIALAADTGEAEPPEGNRTARMCPHEVFPAADEQWVAIAVRTDDEWSRLAREIGGDALDPSLARLAQRKENEERVERLVAQWTARQSAPEVEQRLQALGIAASQAAASAAIVSDPQMMHLDHFCKVERHSGGETTVERTRFRLSDTPADREVRSPPLIGGDNDYVLRDILHYDEQGIATLRANGALG